MKKGKILHFRGNIASSLPKITKSPKIPIYLTAGTDEG